MQVSQAGTCLWVCGPELSPKDRTAARAWGGGVRPSARGAGVHPGAWRGYT